MKKKIFIILFVFMLFIFILFFSLNLVNVFNNEKTKNEFITVNNWNLKKDKYYYELSFVVEKKQVFSNKNSIYILDKENNIICSIDNANIDSNKLNKKYKFKIDYDISNAKNIIIANSKNKIKYKKDISSETIYIGEKNIDDNTIPKGTELQENYVEIEIEI